MHMDLEYWQMQVSAGKAWLALHFFPCIAFSSLAMHYFPWCLHSFSQFCQSCGLPSAIQMFCMVLRWETSFCTAAADVSTLFWKYHPGIYPFTLLQKISILQEALILWMGVCITVTFLCIKECTLLIVHIYIYSVHMHCTLCSAAHPPYSVLKWSEQQNFALCAKISRMGRKQGQNCCEPQAAILGEQMEKAVEVSKKIILHHFLSTLVALQFTQVWLTRSVFRTSARQACSSQYLSNSTKITTNTETAMLSN